MCGVQCRCAVPSCQIGWECAWSLQGSQDQVLRVCIEAMKHILVNDSCHDNEMRGLKTVLVHLDECTSGNTLELSPSMVGQVLLCVCKVCGWGRSCCVCVRCVGGAGPAVRV